MSGLHFESTIDFKKLDQELGLINSKLSDLASHAERSGDRMDKAFSRVGQAIGAYFSFQALRGFTSELINVRGEFEMLEVAFETMLQSKGKADRLMADVVELAAITPFNLTQVGNATKQLLAFQEPLEDVVDTTRRLGDISAGLNTPIEQLVGVYGKVRAQGRLMGQEMLQFMRAGIPMTAELAKHFGVTEKEVAKLVETGKVGFEDVKAVLHGLTNEGGMFFNLMEKESKTLTGMMSNLGDAWARMLDDMGKTNDGILKGSIGLAIDLVENYQRVVDILKVVVATYGAYRAAVMLNAVAVGGLSKALGMATIRQIALNVAQKASPVGLVVMGITALAGALWAYNRSQKAANEAADAASKPLRDEMVQVNALVGALTSANTSEGERKKILKELQEVQPDIVKGLDSEHDSTEKLVERLKEYNEQQLQRIWIARKNAEINALAERQKELDIKRMDEEANAYGRLAKVIQELSDPKTDIRRGSSGYRWKNRIITEEERRELQRQLEEIMASADDVQTKLERASKALHSSPEGGLQGVSNLRTFDFNNTLFALQKGRDEIQEQYDALLEDRDRFIKTFGDPNAGDDPSGGGVEEVIVRNVAYWEEQRKQALAALDLLTGEEKDFYAQQEKQLKAIEEAEERIAFIRGRGKEEKVKTLTDSIEEEIALWDRYYLFLEHGYTDLASKQHEALRQNADSLRDYLIKQEAELQARLQSLDPSSGEYSDTADALRRVKSRQIEMDGGKSVLDQEKERIERQRELFADFESWKAKFGAEMAKERYGEEIGAFESYIDYLQAEMRKLEGKDDPTSISQRAFIGGEISKAESDERKRVQQALEMVLQETQTHNEKIAILELELQAKLKLIEGEGNEERRAMLIASYEKKRQELEAAHMQEVESYQWVFESIDRMNRKALRDYIQRLKEELSQAKYQSAEMLQVRLQLEEKLAQATQKLKDKFPDTLREIGGALRDAAGLAEHLDENLARAINTAAELADAAASIASGLASGNPFQVASGIIRATTALIKHFSAKEKDRKETEKLIESLDRMNEALERQAKLIRGVGAERLEAYRATMAKVASQLAEVEGKMQGIGEKLQGWSTFPKGQLTALGKELQKLGLIGKDVSLWTDQDWLNAIEVAPQKEKAQLEALYAQWLQLKDAQEEYFAQWAEYATGVSFTGLVDEFVNALTSGERNVADFADNVEDLLRKAIIQGFKTKYLMQALEPWYKQFAEFAEDGLSAAEIEQLRSTLQAIFGDAVAAFDALGDLGIDLLGDTAKGLSGAIKGMSQESADLMAGQLGAMRIHLADIASAVVNRGVEVEVARDPALGATMASLGTNLQQMRETALTGNAYLLQIANNTRHLLEIRNLLKGRGNESLLEHRIIGK